VPWGSDFELIMAEVRPGEILVSEAVRDLMTEPALRFSTRGEHCLKGVPGRWPYSLSASQAGRQGPRRDNADIDEPGSNVILNCTGSGASTGQGQRHRRAPRPAGPAAGFRACSAMFLMSWCG
jgi:hypothetical protein